MHKNGDVKKGLYTIIILIFIVLLIFLLYRILQDKVVGGIFGGI